MLGIQSTGTRRKSLRIARFRLWTEVVIASMQRAVCEATSEKPATQCQIAKVASSADAYEPRDQNVLRKPRLHHVVSHCSDMVQ